MKFNVVLHVSAAYRDGRQVPATPRAPAPGGAPRPAAPGARAAREQAQPDPRRGLPAAPLPQPGSRPRPAEPPHGGQAAAEPLPAHGRRGRGPCPLPASWGGRARRGTPGYRAAVAPRAGPGRAAPDSGSHSRAPPWAPREAALPQRTGPGAPEAGALLTPTTSPPFLPGRREPLAAHTPPRPRSAPRPSPTGIQGGPGAVAAPREANGRPPAGSERGAGQAPRGRSLGRRGLRGLIGPGRAAPGRPRALPARRHVTLRAPSWDRLRAGGGGAAADGESQRLGLRSRELYPSRIFCLPPSSAFGTFQKAAPDRWKPWLPFSAARDEPPRFSCPVAVAGGERCRLPPGAPRSPPALPEESEPPEQPAGTPGR